MWQTLITIVTLGSCECGGWDICKVKCVLGALYIHSESLELILSRWAVLCLDHVPPSLTRCVLSVFGLPSSQSRTFTIPKTGPFFPQKHLEDWKSSIGTVRVLLPLLETVGNTCEVIWGQSQSSSSPIGTWRHSAAIATANEALRGRQRRPITYLEYSSFVSTGNLTICSTWGKYKTSHRIWLDVHYYCNHGGSSLHEEPRMS